MAPARLVLPLSLLLAVLLGADPATSTGGLPLPIHLLRPLTGSSGHPVSGVDCGSWRLGVETNNLRGWKTVPGECEGYIGHYMLGKQYRFDSRVVVDAALAYVSAALEVKGNGTAAWVFDIDETSLSNLPYYALHGFGATPFDPTSFNQWVAEGAALVLPESFKLYKNLLSMGIKIILLTGRDEASRTSTTANLKKVGYHTWEKLILRPVGDKRTAVEYKSGERKKLEMAGYRIIGNIGDQWSDILGYPTGERTFKLPDPMYYIG